MQNAAAVVTDHGGRKSHAAIVSWELGVPAVVGARGATQLLKEGTTVTVSCAEGSEGRVYSGVVPFETRQLSWDDQGTLPVALMINLATPDTAFRWWQLPVQGVGLARMEFIINDLIKVHPLALTRFDQVSDPAVREEILALTAGYADLREYFVERLARGVATIAASQYPHPTIVRMSDFKSNEYRKLGVCASATRERFIYPAHDYQERCVSSVAQERKRNPRLGKGKVLQEFSLETQLLARRMRKDSDPNESRLTNIMDEVERLKRLLDDFRSVARSQKGVFERCDLADIGEYTSKLIEVQARESGVRLEKHMEWGVALVQGHPDRLRQVALNLAKNAIEAMPEGGTLRLGVVVQGDLAIISVEDTGMGVPEGIDILNAFQTTKIGGTGLGLAIVNQIVTSHRGSLSWQSAPGKGTTFRVTFPVFA